MLNEKAKARQQRCFRCEYVHSCPNAALRARNEKIDGHRTKVHWCGVLPTSKNGVPEGELTKKFLKNGECPKAYWDGVEIPEEEDVAQQLTDQAEGILSNPFVKKLTDAELEDALMDFVEGGRMPPELATKIMDVRTEA